MAVNRVPVLKRCRSLGMDPIYLSCAINPRCGVSGQIQPVSENERKKVMVIGGGPAGMMAKS